jgi:hypothetical protein
MKKNEKNLPQRTQSFFYVSPVFSVDKKQVAKNETIFIPFYTASHGLGASVLYRL